MATAAEERTAHSNAVRATPSISALAADSNASVT
jgi:hypothetical protein